ncbi:hypothetical protein GCM10027564_17230 [Luteimonas notoginsengisoli]|uniref:HTH araC/xylS-type domain-containing protein n=1 Tax=Luteimonas notoginsengisoli TaxID=1578200 RepID=A0ABV7UU45_9GAMM
MIDQLRALPLGASPGLVRALADARLATALRVMHARPDHDWTVRALARSTFFERFNRAMGIAPLEYLLAWRMALAKDLRGRRERRELSITSVPLHSKRNPPERDAPG